MENFQVKGSVSELASFMSCCVGSFRYSNKRFISKYSTLESFESASFSKNIFYMACACFARCCKCEKICRDAISGGRFFCIYNTLQLVNEERKIVKKVTRNKDGKTKLSPKKCSEKLKRTDTVRESVRD